MRTEDARRLSPLAQEALRVRVMTVVGRGLSQSAAARLFGVSRQAVSTWARRHRQQGACVLGSRPRGRPAGGRLKPWQAATVVRLLADRCPEQLKLLFVLWRREAVRDLIARRFGVRLSVRTVGRYLRRWGFTPQKPLRRAYGRDPVAVRRWLRQQVFGDPGVGPAGAGEDLLGRRDGDALRPPRRALVGAARPDHGDPRHGAAMNFAEIERDYIRRHFVPSFEWVVYPAPSPINPLLKPLSQSRVALVGTAGVHLHGDRPFDVRTPLGDPSFRVIPGDVVFDRLRLAHPGYNTRKIQQDINCVFPLERLRELAQEGTIGGVSSRHFSFMGYIPIPDLLIEKTAPEVANLLREDQVDLALLVAA